VDNLAIKKIFTTLRITQIPFRYYCVNPLLAATDSLVKGMVTKAVTADEDVGLDTETRPHDFLP